MHLAFRHWHHNNHYPAFTRDSFNRRIASFPSHESTGESPPQQLSKQALRNDGTQDRDLDPAKGKSTRLGWKSAQVLQVALVLHSLVEPLLQLHDRGLQPEERERESDVWASLTSHCRLLVYLLKDSFTLEEVKHAQMCLLQQHALLKASVSPGSVVLLRHERAECALSVCRCSAVHAVIGGDRDEPWNKASCYAMLHDQIPATRGRRGR